MSKYKVDEGELNKAVAVLNHIIGKLEDNETQLQSVVNSLANQKGFGIEKERTTLKTQKESIRIQRTYLTRVRDCVQSIMNTTADASAAAKKELESIDLSKALQTAAVIGVATAGNATASNTTSATGTASQSGGTSGNKAWTIPDYALQGNEPDANGVYGPYIRRKDGTYGRVCEWNKTGQMSCTYYTLRKLNERGISYPCVAGPGNGGDWYQNFDFESGIPTFEGGNALYTLAEQMELPQNNIVVSLSEPSPWGHVMLIDSIYRDANGNVMIDSSDMYPDISTINGSNPVQTCSIEEYYNWYNRYNGSVKGIVVLGNK